MTNTFTVNTATLTPFPLPIAVGIAFAIAEEREMMDLPDVATVRQIRGYVILI
jgi:hypothetical protein